MSDCRAPSLHRNKLLCSRSRSARWPMRPACPWHGNPAPRSAWWTRRLKGECHAPTYPSVRRDSTEGLSAEQQPLI